MKTLNKRHLRILYSALFLLSVTISALAQTPTCSSAAKFYSKDSINITTFGASTVAGVGSFAFQPDLKQNFQNCYNGKVIDVTNNGIPGETTTQGLIRFVKAIENRTGFLVIIMGANDAQAIANRKMRLFDTERNMRYYIEESLKRKLTPIVGTIQFYNDQNNQFLKNCNLIVKQINALYKRLAEEYHVYLADLNGSLGRDFSLYQDLVHPNAKGYKLISFVLFDAINEAIEEKFLLIGIRQNYPNPVRDVTKIGYSLSQAGKVLIKLYDILGVPVKSLEDEYQGAGNHELTVNLGDLNAGMYIYVMKVGGQQISKKLLVVK
ncbi:SGNH/GDSL hydrolase family protein [Mucilaginibacter myungsuensis]|uniref:SGNH/GDSL hydrolase family protein n=1 Tax=Mucilaginibacter myungsuensis TaxID=649104 RepID=A0A929L1C3_9SPHI|nr:SGNH/GDSL hydrolase family protein [Mucilaginibacter myungsuensis]MBE9664333.1 SGNH/GDSL hydrolase family protein [Mucilaginibacter myungsuensis]MDN3597043.1 SGNH/GDSL hydrolase family protein [Mucilaginibacter myungsuensis]